MAGLFNSKSVSILSLVLLAQASVFYGFSRNEKIPRVMKPSCAIEE